MARKVSTKKAKRDLMIAEIVYYSIGGFFLLTGILFCIFGVILLNPPTQNFTNHPLYLAQTSFFEAIHWNTNFLNAGSLLMFLSIIYFLVVFFIFGNKGDELQKKEQSKSHRQREVVYEAPKTDNVVSVQQDSSKE